MRSVDYEKCIMFADADRTNEKYFCVARASRKENVGLPGQQTKIGRSALLPGHIMMLPLLNHREAGLSSPLYVRRNLKSRRVSSIDLNEFKSMEQTFNSGILSIDMESQDRRYLIAASSESKVAIYDTAIIENEKECCCSAIAVIDRSQECAHQYSIETVQWYPGDNGMFLTSSLDKSLKVWDSNTLQVAEEYKFSNLVYRHHMSNKHNLVAVGCEGSKIILCDLKSGSTSHTLEAIAAQAQQNYKKIVDIAGSVKLISK
eukprot:gene15588-biopygen13297